MTTSSPPRFATCLHFTYARFARAAVAAAGLVLLLAPGCGRPARDASEPVTFASMLADLTNVAAFAASPPGAAHMESSFDRTGGNNDWRAWNERELRPDGLIDLANLKGPGCVTRIWMTSVPADEWLLFFDGEAMPSIRCTREELFGGRSPFLPPLSNRLSGGFYSYVPLPYAKSLRIAVKPTDLRPDRKPYFQINYVQYPAGTQVQTLPSPLSGKDYATLSAVLSAWQRQPPPASVATPTAAGEIEVAPGSEVEWLRVDGRGMLDTFELQPLFPEGASAVSRARALRELVLRMTWDGATAPSVDVPLGDFFCNAFYRRSFDSLPLSSSGGTFSSRFPMSYARGARAALRNDGTLPLRVRYAFHTTPRTDSPAQASPYFHATWNSSRETGRPFAVLDVQADGHFIGCYLSTIGLDSTWNILEGDERLFVDGETEPSWHGTGLEDFFSGGWYYKGLYDLPLHGLLEKAPMRTDQYRFLLPERVRFRKRFRIEFEFGAANAARGVMSSTAYWYASEPHAAGSAIVPPSLRLHPPDPMMPSGIMAQLFELERPALDQDAAERCRFYGELFAGQPWAPLLFLRALAYEARSLGFDAVAGPVARCIAGSEGETRRQAEALAWFHEGPSNALAFAQSTGRAAVLIDGSKIMETEGVQRLADARLVLRPGRHTSVALVKRTQGINWFSFALRTHLDMLRSDGAWQVAYVREPPDMTPDALARLPWKTVEAPGMGEMLPTNTEFAFQPNAWVGVQSGEQLLRLWYGDDAGRPEPLALLRTAWLVSDSGKTEQDTP